MALSFQFDRPDSARVCVRSQTGARRLLNADIRLTLPLRSGAH